MVVKSRRKHQDEPINDYSIINQVMQEVSAGEESGVGESNVEHKARLDKKYQDGEISIETYDYIINNVLIPEDPNLLINNEHQNHTDERKS